VGSVGGGGGRDRPIFLSLFLSLSLVKPARPARRIHFALRLVRSVRARMHVRLRAGRHRLFVGDLILIYLQCHWEHIIMLVPG
jgi:hypothetical protein